MQHSPQVSQRTCSVHQWRMMRNMCNIMWNTVCVSNLFSPSTSSMSLAFFFSNILERSSEKVPDYKHELCIICGMSAVESLTFTRAQKFESFTSITSLWLWNTKRSSLVFFSNALTTVLNLWSRPSAGSLLDPCQRRLMTNLAIRSDCSCHSFPSPPSPAGSCPCREAQAEGHG